MRRTSFTPSFMTASVLLALCSGCALASGSSPSGTSNTTSQTATASAAASSFSSSAPHPAAPLHEALQPFPAARADQTRWVIQLPPQAREADWRVELIPGQQMQVDCNRHRLIGQLQPQTVQGWGYDYYVLDKVFGPATTRMACPPEQAASARFIAVNLMPENIAWLPYNDQLPIVVYLPEGFTLQYRLWNAAPRLEPALVQ